MKNNDDVEHLLRKMEERFGESSEGAKQMFGMLVTTTLAYRDKLVEDRLPALTVGETQRALDAFMLIMKTQQFPEIDDSRVKDLVMLWLDGVKKTLHH